MYEHEEQNQQSNQDFNRRRYLLTSRLEEQVKTYNHKLLIQNINVTFFVVLFPFLFGGVFFLLGYIIDQAASATGLIVIADYLNWGIEFGKTNSTFHMILIMIGVFFIIGIIIYHFQAAITFSKKELELAGYILAITHKNGITTYQKLRKEIEFRTMTYSQFDNVTDALQKLEHLRTEKKDTKDETIIIRDSNW
jgi:hypothetical protein